MTSDYSPRARGRMHAVKERDRAGSRRNCGYAASAIWKRPTHSCRRKQSGPNLMCRGVDENNEVMRRKRVESTTMKSVGYEARSRILEIEFDSGTVYQYLGVPAKVYASLRRAESKGRYFNDEIRDVYPYVQVGRTSGAW